MDMNNLAVLIVMLALMIGGGLLLNIQIKLDAKKEQVQKARAQRQAEAASPSAAQKSAA